MFIPHNEMSKVFVNITLSKYFNTIENLVLPKNSKYDSYILKYEI